MEKKNELREPDGVLLVAKPAGMTSHDVVGRVRRLYGTRRVGHTGTLDPMATGLLVVLIGRAAKASEYLTVHDKRYRALLRLGMTTDTEDTTGTVLSTCDALPAPDAVREVCAGFVGRIGQIPPMYSALKVDGHKLVDLARRGQVVERQEREVEIFSLDCLPTGVPSDYRLDVHCASGTYIRTLCADIGKKLGCGGVMAELERKSVGQFSLTDAHTLDELDEIGSSDGGAERLEALLLPTESLFSDLPVVSLPDFYAGLCRNGCEIYQNKIHTDLPVGTRCALRRQIGGDSRFFALGEVGEYEGGSAIKAVKIFLL